jgi:hypothetical protein
MGLRLRGPWQSSDMEEACRGPGDQRAKELLVKPLRPELNSVR